MGPFAAGDGEGIVGEWIARESSPPVRCTWSELETSLVLK